MALANFEIVIDLSGSPIESAMRPSITTTLPSPYQPIQAEYRTLAQIVDIKLERQRTYDYQPAGDGLAIAAGLTDTRLQARFINCPAQWRRDGDVYVYLGGTVRVTVQVKIYADERTRERSRRRCWILLMNHELLHVRDEIDIATNWLRTAIEGDAFVRGALTVGNRMPARQFEQNIRPGSDGSGSFLERRIIREIYLPESSNRSAALHRSRPQDTRQLSECLAR